MLVAGGNDDLVSPSDVAELRDALQAWGGTRVEAVTLKMGHALAAEPGLAAEPPIAEAVSVDAALTDWFRARFAVTGAQAPPDQTPVYDLGPRLRAGSWTPAAPTLTAR
jgi:hypothetical protein